MQVKSLYQKGDVIGSRYLVHEALMGGMGEVYLCLDLEDNLPRALKTPRGLNLDNHRLREAFDREVAIWVSLEKHPNIVRCHLMRFMHNRPFILLDWIANDEVRGTSLQSWLVRGQLDLRVALGFAIDICRGLIHAGRKQPGIVHQDLKPGNVLIAQGRIAKITDFGLAKVIQNTDWKGSNDAGDSMGQRPFNVCGTPSYMAPEQWLGGELDARTDIYAVGCILYEMLTGRRPYEASTLSALRDQHIKAAIPILAKDREVPSAISAIVCRSLSKRKEERFENADELLKELLSAYQKEFSDMPREILKGNEFSVVDYLNRGATYHRLGRFEEALADYNRSIQMNPTFVMAYSNRGNTYSALGRYEEALADYNQAVQLDPTFSAAYNNRGLAYLNLNQYEKALEDFNRAIALDSEYAQALTNRGFIYDKLNRHKDALEDYKRAIAVDPEFAKAYHNIGVFARDHLGAWEAALLYFDKAAQLGDPLAQQSAAMLRITLRVSGEVAPKTHTREGTANKLPVIENEGELSIETATEIEAGLACADQHLYDEALTHLNRALELDPANEKAYYNRGLIYEKMDRYDEAVKDYDQAIQINPSYALAYFNRGCIYADMSRYEEALTDLSRAIQFDPSYARAYNNRGVLYERLKRDDEALADYKQAAHLDPTYSLAHYNVGATLLRGGSLQKALPYFEKAAQLGDSIAQQAVVQIKLVLCNRRN